MIRIKLVASELAEHFGYEENPDSDQFKTKYGKGKKSITVSKTESQTTLEVITESWSVVLKYSNQGKFGLCVCTGEKGLEMAQRIKDRIEN